MGVKQNLNVSSAFRGKCKAFMDGIRQSFPLVGEVARDAIVQTTLAGIGEGDSSFAQYSKLYQEQLDAVGGKPSGVVDLRGIFVKDQRYGKTRTRRFKNPTREAARVKRARARGEGRQAFVLVTIGKTSFIARTKVTRARKGLLDPESEMSTDLIRIIAMPNGIRLEYRPRHESYMINHNEGDGVVKREWFSVNKTPVKAAVSSTLATIFRALIRSFNT
jgi:hypothetical protein